MKNNKNSNCGCFSFFRSKKQKIAKSSLVINDQAPKCLLARPPRTQSQNPRCSIVPPSFPIYPPSQFRVQNPSNSIDTNLSAPSSQEVLQNMNSVLISQKDRPTIPENNTQSAMAKCSPDSNPYFIQMPSPDWLQSGFPSPVLGSINLSPVKKSDIAEDYTDLNIFLHPRVPDIFIRSQLNPSLLPVIKATTPCLYTKRRALPVYKVIKA